MAKKKKKLTKIQRIEKILSQKVKVKTILKKTKEATLRIKQKEVPSILGDPNRFFKDEWEETKKTMFLK